MTAIRSRIASAHTLTPWLLSAVLVIHAALLAWSAWRHSPVMSEVAHLPAGISHWTFGRFDLYRVNPPLVRMVAALPVLFAGAEVDWSRYSTNPLIRVEGQVGDCFVKANGSRVFWLYTLGRWACIPFSLVGAIVCFLWARDLYGRLPGLTALVLWCFSPTVLGNGSLMMPDVPAAALGVAACYAFWKWLQVPTLLRAAFSGGVLGLALLTKTTLLIFCPLWPLLWFAYRFGWACRLCRGGWLVEGCLLALQMVIACEAVNLGYGFEGSFQRLADYRFKSHSLTGLPSDDRSFAPGNRFAETWLGELPVPLPSNYVQGIDEQKSDFERGMPSYLAGEWSERGWWYFYLYALAIKAPLGLWGLVLLAALATCRRGAALLLSRDELVIAVPTAAVLLLVSSQTGFSIHFRYVLPVLPFCFIFAGKAFARCAPRVQTTFTPARVRLVAACACLIWFAGGSVRCYPHSLSYFNESIGGPSNGHNYLLNSATAWGQDLLYLKRWYDDHPEARPLHVASFGPIDPRLAGLKATPILRGFDERIELPPGWYAIDVNHLCDTRSAPICDGSDAPCRVATATRIGALRDSTSVDRVGFSIRVFRVRRERTRIVIVGTSRAARRSLVAPSRRTVFNFSSSRKRCNWAAASCTQSDTLADCVFQFLVRVFWKGRLVC